ncbi:50S ribosomal protein L18, chloroplastic [Ananas comosus]|uniref:Large ribosomal subunit protein uL18c n=1 Tax=Ananas comosus TaxID=4615 RepID=A0A6P5FZL5_ANACO|nr:50S ribosomal protein L18, chloroplastic [Ananas comosus]
MSLYASTFVSPPTTAASPGSSSSAFIGARQPLSAYAVTAPPPSPATLRRCEVAAKALTRRENRAARHERIRKKVEGTPERPRMSVFRSNKHLYVQVIDDTKMHTLASASTMQKPVSEGLDYSSGPTIEVAKKVGEAIAKACLEKGVTKVAFDRGGYPYHGRVEALASAAREQGLEL